MLRPDSGASPTLDHPEIATFRADVRAKLAAVLEPRDHTRVQIMGSPTFDLDHSRRYMATMAELGFAAPHWPVEHGGLGASVEMAEVIEAELASFDVPGLYPFFVALFPAAGAILAHGCDAQRERWLPRILRGLDVWCQMFSEPDAGSDLANARCSAVHDGDIWRVDGTKLWVGRGTIADWGFLLARTDPEASKHGGLTTFAVNMRLDGVEVRPTRQMNGSRNFSEVRLHDVCVPDTDRIGLVNEGWKVVASALASERDAVRTSLGLTLQRILDLAPHATSALGRQRLTRVVSEFKITQWTAERSRIAARTGRPGPGASVGKLQTGRLLKQLARASIDLLGPEEMAWVGDPSDWQLDFQTSPANSIRGGTDEILRNVIGERDLGLPREGRLP